ncbi:PREDICTED: uncharacterized protein LOC104727971 [Camelina sativa]|uniref:Uncharacterized protein LOC104727971 n=1 Tax=Camelina sativa TaxID=90675 RepID=A0ABM0US34_CAMSA|nr:PREDICTED: uncharacterized protein LOC104727971 [Camelina sativa]
MGPPPQDIANLTVANLITFITMDWDREKLQETLPGYVDQILEIKPSTLGAKDTYAWLPTTSSIYSAKSGYNESIVHDPKSGSLHDLTSGFSWNTHIWKSHCTPKLKLFMWKLMREALPVGENLRKRRMNVEATFWRLAPLKEPLNVHLFATVREGIEKLQNVIVLPPSGVGQGPLHPWTLWKIWKERNNKLFSKRHESPKDTLSAAIALGREWQDAQILPPKPKQARTKESNPIAGSDFMNLHTDAAWDMGSRKAGLGWLSSTTIRESKYLSPLQHFM